MPSRSRLPVLLTKKREGHTGRWLISFSGQDLQRYLDEINKNEAARDALKFFTEQSESSKESWLFLFLAVVKTSVDQLAKQEFGLTDTKPEKALKLAQQIDNIAHRIRSLNEEPHWMAERLGIAKAKVLDLSNIMHSYSRMLSSEAESISRRQALYKKIGNSRHRAEEELFEKIEELTGRKYRNKAAEILGVLSRMPEHGLYPANGESHRKRKYRKLK